MKIRVVERTPISADQTLHSLGRSISMSFTMKYIIELSLRGFSLPQSNLVR